MDFNNNIAIDKNSMEAQNIIKINTNQLKNINKVSNKNQKNNEENLDKNNGYDEKIAKTLKQVNEKFKTLNRELSYEVHKKTNRYMVTVKNSETGDIIKEIPSEESLDLFAKMLEMAGLLIDEKS